mmetsp:Transcript_4686/g.15540  ORF Transcript_4686/g.15540 Transcript_4686/m.15540 type:complete len:173 (-) Transcript_4686:270-788(-)
MAASDLSYKRDQRLQDALLKEIQALLRDPDNANCADCGATLRSRSAFCSVTLGVWLCNRCYGIHRSVGAHVTRTKCVGLDAFHPDEVAFMRSRGNRWAHATFAATAPKGAQPTPESSDREVERWIRDKYELRRYSRPAQAQGAAATPTVAQPTAANAAGNTQAVERDLISFD